MNKKDVGLNILLVIGLVFALIGLLWLHNLGLAAGLTYIIIFVIGLIFLLIALLYKFIGKLDFWFKIPTSGNTNRAVLMLFLGILTMTFFSISSLISGKQFFSPFLMAPLTSLSLGVGTQTFSALQASASPFWVFFISVISASVIEEIVLGFFFVKIGSLTLGYGTRNLLSIDLGDKWNYSWDFAGAMLFSVLLFMVLHFFNGTYLTEAGKLNFGMFAYAAIFRLVLNILIYRLGNFGLLYSIGVHAVNNAIFLGSATVLVALATFPGGVILDGILIIIVIYFFTHLSEIKDEFILAFKEFLTWN